MAITTNQRLAASNSAVTTAAGEPASAEAVRNILLAYIAENGGGGVDLTAPGPIGATTPGSASFTTLAASGVASLSNGTAALPSLHFGDSTTGIYRNASTRIGITTNGVLRVAIYDSGMYMSSGALGINTSNWFRIGAGGVELTTTTGGGTYAPLYISNLTASGQVFGTSTSYNTPVFVVGSSLTSGMSATGTVGPTIISGGVGIATFHGTNGVLLKSTLPLAWSNAEVNGAADTGLSRKTATGGTIRVGNGTANDASGSIELANLTASGTITATPNTLTGAGAISISTSCNGYISTGAAQALTLADGANGQIKTIIHTSDGGSGVLTPTTKPSTYTTITFTNVGDAVTLQFITGTGWCIIGIYGAVAA